MQIDPHIALLIHHKTQQNQKRHTIQITSKTLFSSLEEQVKELYKITQNPFDLFVTQNGRQILLTQESFEFYKGNVHVNKIIRVTEYDVLDYAFIQKNKKQEPKVKVNVKEGQLIPIKEGSSLSVISSFLADDFHKLASVLGSVCTLAPQIQYSKEEEKSLQFINEVVQSLSPTLQKFYSQSMKM